MALGLSGALLEQSWAILDALTARDRPRPGPGEGVGGGVKTPSPPASRLAHSHPPSQHISNTRGSLSISLRSATHAMYATGSRCTRHPGGPSEPGAPGAARAPRLSNMPAPPPSLSKTNAKWSRGACACSRCGGKVHSVLFFDRDGWLARSEQYDGTPAVPVKKRCKVVAGRPRMLQIWRQSAF